MEDKVVIVDPHGHNEGFCDLGVVEEENTARPLGQVHISGQKQKRERNFRNTKPGQEYKEIQNVYLPA
jgi:hypothetical protein